VKTGPITDWYNSCEARRRDRRFIPLPAAKLERLIKKGAEDARELDKNIRSQFELGPEANMRLR